MIELKHLTEQTISLKKSKETFFASMSHELRNPLNALLGTLEILSNSKKREDKLIETANICGSTLLNLIGTINK